MEQQEKTEQTLSAKESKALLDSGAITQEEFAALKQKLIG